MYNRHAKNQGNEEKEHGGHYCAYPFTKGSTTQRRVGNAGRLKRRRLNSLHGRPPNISRVAEPTIRSRSASGGIAVLSVAMFWRSWRWTFQTQSGTAIGSNPTHGAPSSAGSGREQSI